MNFRLFSLLLPCLIGFVACADEPEPTPPPRKTDSNLVGRVVSIHEKQSFVLIQSFRPSDIETGVILATVGPNGRSANLRVTGEKTGQFAAADIQSGTVEVGDAVYTTLSKPKAPEEEFESVPTTEPVPEISVP